MARMSRPIETSMRAVVNLETTNTERRLAKGRIRRLCVPPIRATTVARVTNCQIHGAALIPCLLVNRVRALVRMDVPTDHEVDASVVQHVLKLVKKEVLLTPVFLV